MGSAIFDTNHQVMIKKVKEMHLDYPPKAGTLNLLYEKKKSEISLINSGAFYEAIPSDDFQYVRL